MIWEDICYSRGLLVSPGFFKEFRAKPLGEIISFMKSAGMRGIIVGTGGNCHEMPPI
jgi:hypothetical protein